MDLPSVLIDIEVFTLFTCAVSYIVPSFHVQIVDIVCLLPGYVLIIYGCYLQLLCTLLYYVSMRAYRSIFSIQ